MIYLDNSATTRVHPKVVEAMVPYLDEKWGNPSSIHGAGQEAKTAVQTARQQLALLLNCHPDEIYFAPSGTHANNVAILGRARFAEANNHGRHFITSTIEHPAVMGPAKFLESQGWEVDYLPVDKEGFVEPAQLAAAITNETSIISIMWANNEIGTVEPITELAQIAADKEIYFHTDAIQIAGKLPIDLNKVPVSTLSVSGHKLHAPKGIGALIVRKGVNVMPLVFGGGQEQGLFPGTEALANIVGLGFAAEICRQDLDNNADTLRKFQQVFVDELSKVSNVRLTGPTDLKYRLPGHVSFTIEGVEGEAMVVRAALQDICISSGSACHQGMIEPSHVLRAIGMSESQAKGSVRISCSRFNSLQECKDAAKLLVDILDGITPAKQTGTAIAL
jgi:cysteine desulfurase